MRKLSNKEKFEMLVGKVVINIIMGFIFTGLILAFFWVVGLLELFMETHLWALALLGIVAFGLLLKNL